MTDDPLIAEIDKMILDLKAEYDKHPSPVWRGKIGFTILKLGELHKVAVADIASAAKPSTR